MQQHITNPARNGQAPPAKETTNPYRRFLLDAWGEANYFKFYRPFYSILKKLDALFLQDLINIASCPNTVLDGEWFLCGEGFLERGHWSVKEQEKHFANLIRAGFIRKERRGIPPRRWVSINVEKVVLALAAQSPPFGGDLSPPDGGVNKVGIPNGIPTLTEYKNTRRAGGGGAGVRKTLLGGQTQTPATKGGGPLPSEEDRENAARLHRAAAVRVGRVRPYNREAWAKEFSHLRGEVGPARVSEVLDWHVKHIKDKYTPHVWCAKEFRRDFEKVVAAMERDRERNPDVTISPAAEEMADLLRRKEDCGAAKAAEAVQLSMDNAAAFHKACLSLGGRGRVAGFGEYVAEKLIGDMSTDTLRARFAFHWFREDPCRGGARRDWSRWRGDLLPLAFRPGAKLTDAAGREWARKYAGEPSDLWDRLIKEIQRDG